MRTPLLALGVICLGACSAAPATPLVEPREKERASAEDSVTVTSESETERATDAVVRVPDAIDSAVEASSSAVRPSEPEPPPQPTTLDFDHLTTELATGDSGRIRAAQRVLRGAIARRTADGPIAALTLANWYALQEDHGDALALLDAGLRGAPADRGLRLARALILRDLGQWVAASQALRGLVVEDANDARSQAELASIEYILEDYESAATRMQRVLGPLVGDAWVVASKDNLRELQREIETTKRTGVRTAGVIELLARVRSSEDPGERRDALNALLQTPAARPRALRVALLHDDLAPRLQGIRALQATDPGHQSIVAAALRSQEAKVRATASRAAVRLELDPILMLRALYAEKDPYAFRCLHDSLRETVGPEVDLPLGAEESAEQRRKTQHAWRQLWNR